MKTKVLSLFSTKIANLIMMRAATLFWVLQLFYLAILLPTMVQGEYKEEMSKLISSNHDMITDGKCQEEIKQLCNVKEGYARIATCMRGQLLQKKAKGKVSPDCRKEVRQFFKEAMQDPLDYLPELSECTQEISSYCKLNRGPFVLSCLKRNSGKLSDNCREVVSAEQQLEAQSIEIDPNINAACHDDLAKLCDGVSQEGGKQKLCLEKNQENLSGDCKEKLFEREVEDAGFIRNDPALEETCEAELQSYCGDGEYGPARKLSCLWEHQHDDGFSTECAGMVLEKTIHQEQDYRLDYRVRTYCSAAIDKLCSDEKLIQDKELQPSGLVMNCLKDKYEQLKDESCKNEMVRVIAIQNTLWLADLNLAFSCHQDVQMFCADQELENVNECLRAHYKYLSPDCRNHEFAEMKVEAQDIRMKPRLQKACKTELRKFCPDISNSQAESLECLQDSIEKEEMGAGCKKMLLKEMEQTSVDFRLKYGIHHYCKSDILNLCATSEAGEVLACLKQKRGKIREPKCRHELKRIIVQQMEDIKTAPEIAKPCDADIARFCADLPPNQVHDCLQSHYDDLFEECKNAEGLVQLEQVEDIDLNPRIKRMCEKVIKNTCKDVPNETGEIIRCLEDSLEADEMTLGCRNAVMKITQMKNKELAFNPILQKECAKEFDHLDCSKFPGRGGKLQCLIDNVDAIKLKGCKQAVQRKISQRIADARNDPQVSKQCNNDIIKFCNEEDPSNIHDCLFSHFDELGDRCKEAEFKDQVLAAAAEEFSFNPRTKGACMATKAKVCRDIPWSSGLEVLACLEDHIESNSMTKKCRNQLEKINQKSAKAIELNPFLTKHCRKTLQFLANDGKCPVDQGKQGNEQTLDCLTTNYEDITSPLCKANVFQSMKLQVMDYRNKPRMEVDCKRDVEVNCNPDETNYVNTIECLKDNVNQVKNKKCVDHIEQMRKMQSRDWMLNPALKAACTGDVKAFCASIPHGKARVLSCLKLNQQRVSENCAEEVEKVQIDSKALPKFNLAASNQNGDGDWLELRGWMALAALAALAFVIIYGIYSCLQRNKRGSKSYTVVVNKD